MSHGGRPARRTRKNRRRDVRGAAPSAPSRPPTNASRSRACRLPATATVDGGRGPPRSRGRAGQIDRQLERFIVPSSMDKSVIRRSGIAGGALLAGVVAGTAVGIPATVLAATGQGAAHAGATVADVPAANPRSGVQDNVLTPSATQDSVAWGNLALTNPDAAN